MKLEVKGQLGETSDLFQVNFKNLPAGEDIEIDLAQMTYISSIGVKNWMSWLTRIPAKSQVKLHNCPIVIVSQASMVFGFLPANFFVENFKAPYVCSKCSAEKVEVLKRGTHYDFASKENKAFQKLPEDLKCAKCNSEMEPDFLEEKVFKFLER